MGAMTDVTLPLAAEFPAATEDDWRDAVRGVILKGRPDATDDEFAAAFVRQLVHITPDGIPIEPLYTAGPEPDAATRGARTGPWEIRQRVWAGVDGSSAVAELESGATGVLIELPGASADTLDQTLTGVHLNLAPVSLATPADDDGVAAAHLLIDLWERSGTPLAERAGTLGADPIGAWARTGGRTDLDAAHRALAELVDRLTDHPAGVRAYVSDGTLWHEAGATPVQELAWTIAAAVATVRAVPALATGGTPRIEFRWAADVDQFMTIAKLRAARQLWSRVAAAGLSPDHATAFHAADGSRAMLTRYDTWTNALRSTVACFAAGVGGADAVTVWPHDALLTLGGSPLGRRIARNTQTILQSESNLWRVRDMAGGSWYVETLTAQLAEKAWSEIQTIDGLGGLIDAVHQGHVHSRLDAVLADRSVRLATRTQPLTGLSEFPDIGETPPPPLASPAVPTDTPFAPLRLQRLADGFEAQRGRADAHARASGERPTVYLAQLGTLADATARTTFAKNLFEAAGIRTIAGPPADFPTSGASVVCLCSSDKVYAEQAAAAAADLRAAGAARIVIAGRRLDIPGVDEEVGLGSDVLDFLTRTLDTLGVAP